MPRYIDADLLKLNDFEILLGGSYKGLLQILLEKIEDAPTVDAVEVVRCKDCKYQCYANYITVPFCGKMSDYGHEILAKDNFYCAWGKRREDAKTH